jgi:hypothetical protein
MDRFDRDILNYMLMWDPHGGLFEEDLFPEFGMNVHQFRQRFAHLVGSYDLRDLDPADRDLIESSRRYHRHRQFTGLRHHGTPGSHGLPTQLITAGDDGTHHSRRGRAREETDRTRSIEK